MQNIIKTIRKYKMIQSGMHVLAGVSGGADSVCLLAALLEFQHECPFTVTVVHVEHGIRGEESREDAKFVQNLCAKMGADCRTEHVDAPREAKERGLSLEEAARILRYQIFEQVRRETGADVIAVAHNENDQAETVLWNLIRGSALKGLGGIRPVRGNIIRPLLFTSRGRIEQILRERNLDWRTDRTNFEVEYTRNRLRMEVLPYFERYLNKKASEHIAKAAEQLQEAQSYIESQVKHAAERCIADSTERFAADRTAGKGRAAHGKETDGAGQGTARRIFLKLDGFTQEEPYIQGELLRECISRCAGGMGLKDVGNVHIEMLRRLAEMPCGRRQDLPGGITASRRDGVILFEKKTTVPAQRRGTREGNGKAENVVIETTDGCGTGEKSRKAENVGICGGSGEYFLDLNGRTEIGDMTVITRTISREQFDAEIPHEILSEKKYTKWLSCDTIKNNVYCRKRKTGDYLTVNAQGGRKKLKDYMIDCKIPREERDSLWLFADGAHVLWLPGFRISEAAKVTDETETVLEIRVIRRV